MTVIKELLAHLARSDVTEVCLASGDRPRARTGTALQPIDDVRLSSDDLVQILFTTGGSRYVESLGPKPTQWRTRVDGIGAVTVSASMTGSIIEARFALRDASGVASIPPQPRAHSIPAQPAITQPAIAPAIVEAPPRRASLAAPIKAPLETGRSARAMPAAQPSAAHAFHHGDFASEGLPGGMPTPARGFDMPRAAMASDLEIDLDIPADQIPTIPKNEARLNDRSIKPDGVRAASYEAPPRAEPQRIEPQRARVVEPQAARPVQGRSTQPFARDARAPLFRQLLRAARDLAASDLHIVAGRPALFRVAGQIHARGEPLDERVVEDMILARVPGRLGEVLTRDGSCDFSLDEPELGRFRVNAANQRTGMKASLRLIAQTIPTLAALGLPESIAAATRHHQGLIVVTGPAGQGKTTTLAALVDVLNTQTTRHVITVEDPIEFIHPRKRAMMSQREVGTHTRSFQTALKAALREDPDVIVVGELRDTETVRMALAASETGHLVLGTMSTPSAAKTIDRLIDLFPPSDQAQVRMTLAGGLRLIVGQRLCPDREGKAMIAAAEVLPGVVPLWNLIREGRTFQIPSLQQRGKELGVIRLDDSLRELVRTGRTTPAAAIAIAESPDELEHSLGARTAANPANPAPAPPPPPAAPPRVPDAKGSEPGASPKGIFERAGALFKKG